MNSATNKIQKFERLLLKLSPAYEMQDFTRLTTLALDHYDVATEYIDRVRANMKQGFSLEIAKIHSINAMWGYHKLKFEGKL